MKNILILGGTGAIGNCLVSQILVNSQYKCVITTRRDLKGEGNISYVRGNAHDITFLKSLLNQKWYAIVDFMAYTTKELEDRIQLLLSSTEQYIFLSSARVYANSLDHIIENSARLLDVSDDSKYKATDEYALAKAREEDIIINTGSRNYTIVRPYITFSESRFQLGVMEKEDWLYRALQGRTIIFSEDIAQKVTTLTYGEDVAKGIFGIIGNEDAYGNIYHITTNETHTWDEILQMYKKALFSLAGKNIKVIYTDAWQSYQGGFEYQVKYDRLYNRRFDNSRILEIVPSLVFSDLESSINRALLEMIMHPSFGKIDWEKEAAKDKLTKEWASLSEIPSKKNKIKYILVRLGLKKSI